MGASSKLVCDGCLATMDNHESGLAGSDHYIGSRRCGGKWLFDISDQIQNAISPSHYHSDTALEVIDVIEAFRLGYNLGNVIKYILRVDKKGERVENLRKARQYLNREIEGKWFE